MCSNAFCHMHRMRFSLVFSQRIHIRKFYYRNG